MRAFSVNRNLLPEESFIAHLFIESGHDGIALKGKLQETSQEIPEPSVGVALGLVGLMAWKKRRSP
ncbi:MAG: PEP-CTERM sorting domain-containing protein [Leptolyngbyaceae bacterium]|nr:PEP-CTERM sorting domain-containing protein [Leptolyngbyaceae bacterium]